MTKNIYNGFIRIYIIYHATEEKICGIEIMEELKRHGYTASPGTVYPILHKMNNDKLLVAHNEIKDGKRRIYYKATPKGKKVLDQTLEKIKEFYDEVILNE
jgi:PadR family transcriptional regulator, regulatory protein PadR